jgi:hypothetical protein
MASYDILLPSLDIVSQCYISPLSPTTHFDKVADPSTANRVWHDGAYGFRPKDIWGFGPTSGTITKIKVRGFGGHANSGAFIQEIMYDGVNYWYGINSSGKTSIFRTHLTNPFTGLPWTTTPQAGVRLTDSGIPSGVWCYYYYIIVCHVDAAVRTDNNTRNITTATINGTVLEDEGETACTVRFEWGETTTYGNTTAWQTKVKGDTFSANISGLNPIKIYHYRAMIRTPGDEVGFFQTFYGRDRVILVSPMTLQGMYVCGNELQAVFGIDTVGRAYRSPDLGSTWYEIDGIDSVAAHDIAFDSKKSYNAVIGADDRLYTVASGEVEDYYSATVGAVISGTVNQIITDMTTPVAFVATDEKLYKTVDWGRTAVVLLNAPATDVAVGGTYITYSGIVYSGE